MISYSNSMHVEFTTGKVVNTFHILHKICPPINLQGNLRELFMPKRKSSGFGRSYSCFARYNISDKKLTVPYTQIATRVLRQKSL